MTVPEIPIDLLVFLLTALFMVAASCIVTFGPNLIHSGFALLGTLFGSAVLFGLLSSDFVAVTQLLVYVGGILVLILFAIMLTAEIGTATVTNQSLHYKQAVPLIFFLLIFMWSILPGANWVLVDKPESMSMVAPIGNALLQEYLLPFEVISLLLLGVLVGAVVLVRREVR